MVSGILLRISRKLRLSWARSQLRSWLLFHPRDQVPSHQRFSRFIHLLYKLLIFLFHVFRSNIVFFFLFCQPDITAPGVSVIAAYTGAEGPTNQDFDTRRVPFNSVSGTSMSCPHVSGVVGLLKTLHPTWSPAAIKSAIITTGNSCYHACICVLSCLSSIRFQLLLNIHHTIRLMPCSISCSKNTGQHVEANDKRVLLQSNAFQLRRRAHSA